jgi:Zn-dependent M28 family amino/carboxypeptidase
VLTQLTEFGDRLGGHPGEQQAAALLAETLADAGVADVETQTFGIPVWTRGETSLLIHVHDRDRERTFEARSLPYCPEATVEGPLVDVGYGTPEELDAADIEGAMVVASTETPPTADRFHHRMEKIGRAAEAGAKGFVFANHRPGQLPPTGSVRVGDSLPAVGVSYETGEWLREYAEEGAAVRVNVTASVDPGTSRNVVGHVGPDTDEELLVCAHMDAHDIAEGALDNGCGVAVLVAVASMLAELDLDRGVRVAALGSEELGLQGSETLAATTDTDSLAGVVNLDGVGRQRTLRALTHGSEQLGEVAERVVDGVGHPVVVEERPHPYSDHWPFLKRGVPALQLHSQADDDAGHWERGWTHTRADTRDKADPRTIREHAMLTTLLVAELAGRDLERVDTDALRERFVDAEPSMRAAGMWPERWDGAVEE